MKKIQRITKHAKIGGVCQALAYYFNTDVSLTRSFFLISLIVNPLTILAYLVCWAVFPKK